MKTAVSIPDPIFREADRLARKLGMSRSELYAKALQSYLTSRRGKTITQALDRVYARADSAPDPVLIQIQSLSLPREDW